MGKSLKMVTEKRQATWYRKHRKSIDDGCYEPFWRAEDVRSSGIKVKVRHFKDPNRVVHLLSMNEMFMYQLIAWDTSISEVYEQFAIPLEESIAIADQLGVKHPVYLDSRTPIVQTVDFICLQNDQTKKCIAVKQKSWLEDQRTQEKLAIQEGYCLINDYDFQIVSSDELKTNRCQNLEFLFNHANLDQLLIGVFRVWISNFFGTMADDREDRVAHILERSAKLTGIPYRRAAHFFFHAIWVSLLEFNWHRPLLLEASASDLELKPNDKYCTRLRG
ncbi:TnsA endonuclease N-terminal domain-containing protein [Shewanella atlantica]|uniref:TnsA endonuclease N-terminal domain-containing protein n=1 Tax=Shewanella atlantica TaxID=271099 RepID=A0A431VUS2_9GAMM|nr:TnsA endonuclease N-terminal domain-containing protein [Shewanella atlantica]RTR27018.1 hypothetical protein EKG39_21135 [Shewanella atlantica]